MTFSAIFPSSGYKRELLRIFTCIRRPEQGVIYVEVLVCLLPFLMAFLGIVQLSFLYVANLIVQHASYTGARAAIVVLDDDPAYYGGEPRNAFAGGSSQGNTNPIAGLLGSESSEPSSVSSAREQSIRSAIYTVLLPLSPEASALLGDDVLAKGLGRNLSCASGLGPSLQPRSGLCNFPRITGRRAKPSAVFAGQTCHRACSIPLSLCGPLGVLAVVQICLGDDP